MSTRRRIPTEKGQSYRQEIETQYQDQFAKIKTECDQLMSDIAREEPEEDNRSEFSNCSSTLVKTSAKAQAARTRIKYIEEEAD